MVEDKIQLNVLFGFILIATSRGNMCSPSASTAFWATRMSVSCDSRLRVSTAFRLGLLTLSSASVNGTACLHHTTPPTFSRSLCTGCRLLGAFYSSDVSYCPHIAIRNILTGKGSQQRGLRNSTALLLVCSLQLEVPGFPTVLTNSSGRERFPMLPCHCFMSGTSY